MRPDAMQDDRTSTHAINKQEVRSEMALHEPAPIRTTLAEAVLAEGRRKLLASDEELKNVFEGFDVEIWMVASVSIIALEARQND
jgi:hypothetical protein